MKKLLLPILAVSLMVPAVAQAADPCRNAKGQFAKCGTPGSMTLAQYKAMKASKTAAPAAKPMAPATMASKPSLFGPKPAPKPTAKPTAGPMATPSSKPSLMSKLKAMGKPKPAATTAAKH